MLKICLMQMVWLFILTIYQPISGNFIFTCRRIYKNYNIIEVLKAYENGDGPDIVTLVELESDQHQETSFVDPADF